MARMSAGMMNEMARERVMNSIGENCFLNRIEIRVAIFQPGRKKTIERAESEYIDRMKKFPS